MLLRFTFYVLYVHYTLKRLLITGAQNITCGDRRALLFSKAYCSHCMAVLIAHPEEKKYPLINHWTFTYFCSYYKLKGKICVARHIYYVIASVNGPFFRHIHTHPSNLKALEWWFFATQFSLLACFWSASERMQYEF